MSYRDLTPGMQAVVIVIALIVGSAMLRQCSNQTTSTPQRATTTPPAAARPAETLESSGCKALVESAQSAGAIQAAGVTRDGMTVAVDTGWTKMGFENEKMMAECVSHYVAGSQDKWIKKISFVNRATGVTYGTIENTRYRSGE